MSVQNRPNLFLLGNIQENQYSCSDDGDQSEQCHRPPSHLVRPRAKDPKDGAAEYLADPDEDAVEAHHPLGVVKVLRPREGGAVHDAPEAGTQFNRKLDLTASPNVKIT